MSFIYYCCGHSNKLKLNKLGLGCCQFLCYRYMSAIFKFLHVYFVQIIFSSCKYSHFAISYLKIKTVEHICLFHFVLKIMFLFFIILFSPHQQLLQKNTVSSHSNFLNIYKCKCQTVYGRVRTNPLFQKKCG